MVDHKQVYLQEGEKYQQLIAREDYLGNLLPAIQDIIPFAGLDVVDLGSGTGRLAALLGPTARRLLAFDRSAHMLGVAAELFEERLVDHSLAAVADHRAIPLPHKSTDLIISGWSFCYLAVWEEEDWRAELSKGLREIKRVLRDEGQVILIETLGTGVTDPQPPEKLESYLKYLEELGFMRHWIRTDYKFHSQEEALELTRFFFGEGMLIEISQEDEPTLAECSGIWWCRAADL